METDEGHAFMRLMKELDEAKKKLKEQEEKLKISFHHVNFLTKQAFELNDNYWKERRFREGLGFIGDIPREGYFEREVERRVMERYSELYYSPYPGPGYMNSEKKFNEE